MSFATEFLSHLGTWVTGFWGIVTDTITQAITIFYDSTTGLTTLGILALFGLGVGLVTYGMSFVMRLLKK